MIKARFYEKLDNGRVRCTACNFRCLLSEGRRGLCGVRQNINGDLYCLVYGKPIATHIDPIEKKPLFHFYPGTRAFSIGTVGCDFSCAFCQNYDISQSPKEDGKIIGEEITPKEIVSLALKNRCSSIAYTYNEPVIFIEFALDIAKLAKREGLKNVWVTNGYETEEALKAMCGLIDSLNIDLKSFSDDFYKNICGARLKPVLETIKRAHRLGFWIEITTLIIPGKNDSKKELTYIAKFIASINPAIPWHISRFFPHYKMKDIPPTDIETLKMAYKIGKEAGLKYVYIGNIVNVEFESTFCPKCNELLIQRFGYNVNKLTDSKCHKCGENIDGRFK